MKERIRELGVLPGSSHSPIIMVDCIYNGPYTTWDIQLLKNYSTILSLLIIDYYDFIYLIQHYINYEVRYTKEKFGDQRKIAKFFFFSA